MRSPRKTGHIFSEDAMLDEVRCVEFNCVFSCCSCFVCSIDVCFFGCYHLQLAWIAGGLHLNPECVPTIGESIDSRSHWPHGFH